MWNEQPYHNNFQKVGQGLNLQRQTVGHRNLLQVGIINTRTLVNKSWNLNTLTTSTTQDTTVSYIHWISSYNQGLWIHLDTDGRRNNHQQHMPQSPMASEEMVCRQKIDLFPSNSLMFQMLCPTMLIPKGIVGRSHRQKPIPFCSPRQRSQQWTWTKIFTTTQQ